MVNVETDWRSSKCTSNNIYGILVAWQHTLKFILAQSNAFPILAVWTDVQNYCQYWILNHSIFFFRLLWSTSGQAPPKNQYGTKILIKFTNTQSRNFEQEYNKTDRTIYKAPLKLNIQSTNWPKGHFSYSTKPSCIFNNNQN